MGRREGRDEEGEREGIQELMDQGCAILLPYISKAIPELGPQVPLARCGRLELEKVEELYLKESLHKPPKPWQLVLRQPNIWLHFIFRIPTLVTLLHIWHLAQLTNLIFLKHILTDFFLAEAGVATVVRAARGMRGQQFSRGRQSKEFGTLKSASALSKSP